VVEKPKGGIQFMINLSRTTRSVIGGRCKQQKKLWCSEFSSAGVMNQLEEQKY
jgi:hypothetical protein